MASLSTLESCDINVCQTLESRSVLHQVPTSGQSSQLIHFTSRGRVNWPRTKSKNVAASVEKPVDISAYDVPIQTPKKRIKFTPFASRAGAIHASLTLESRDPRPEISQY